MQQAYPGRRVNWIGSDGKPEVTTTTYIAYCKYYAYICTVVQHLAINNKRQAEYQSAIFNSSNGQFKGPWTP